MTIRTDAAYQTGISVYTGSSIAGLARVPLQQQQAFNGGPEQIRVRVEAGVTYRIAVDGRYGVSGDFTLSLGLSDLPVNDDFTEAVSLGSDLSLSVAGTNINATQQVGEPVHDDNYCDPSVWYSWTAPASGGVTLDTTGSEMLTSVGVYTGSSLGALTRAPMTRVRVGTNADLRFLRVQAGVTYRIAVDGACGFVMGNFKLALRFALPPVNDLFSRATALAGTATTVAGSLIGATGEQGEPNPGGMDGASAWYTWRAPSSGRVDVKASSSQFTPGIAAYTGDSISSLTPVKISGGSFAVKAGATYRVGVHNGSATSGGDFSLALTHHEKPANDDLAAAAPITGLAPTASGSTLGASGEAGEPNPGGADGASVWYSWTPSAAGRAVVKPTAAEGFTPSAAVYTGDSVGGLTSVRQSDGSFVTRPGTTYRIAVHGGSSANRGTFSLGLTHYEKPANDDFAASQSINESTGEWIPGSTLGASGEVAEPNAGGLNGASVWYSWRAPSSGVVDASAKWSGFYGSLQVYSGDTLSELKPLSKRFTATEGQVYRIAVHGGSWPERGNFSVRLQRAPPNDAFTDAVTVRGNSATVDGSTEVASSEPSEPSHSGSMRSSVWYSWTAERSGKTVIEAYPAGVGQSITMGVYTGDAVGGLSTIATDHHSGSTGGGRVTIEAKAGTTYRIAVDGCSAVGPFRLAIDGPPDPPANDAFDRAQEIAGTPTDPVPGTNMGATGEAGEPNPGGTAATSVWYSWRAPRSGLAEVSATSTQFSPEVAVFSGGSLDALTRLASGGRRFSVTEGTTYRFAVHGGTTATSGRFSMSLRLSDAAPNDNFASAKVLSGNSAEGAGSNSSASVEPGEPTHAGDADASVWYTWTAERSGLTTVNVTPDGGAQNTTVGVDTGDRVDGLSTIATDHHSGSTSGSSTLTFEAKAGTTYRVAVDGCTASSTGAFKVGIAGPPDPPSNDAFANAQELPEAVTSPTAGTTLGATSEPDEPGGSSPSVWYTWRAPRSVIVQLGATSNSFYPGAQAYSGDSLGELTPPGSRFPAIAGRTYRIAVRGSSSYTRGPFSLTLSVQDPVPNDNFATHGVSPDRRSLHRVRTFHRRGSLESRPTGTRPATRLGTSGPRSARGGPPSTSPPRARRPPPWASTRVMRVRSCRPSARTTTARRLAAAGWPSTRRRGRPTESPSVGVVVPASSS